MKKIVLISVITLCMIMSLVIIKKIKTISHNVLFTVGIIQTASHPALDAVRDGFIEELKNKLGENIAFVIQNAQGSIAHAHALAQQFHADQRFDAFFSIGTATTQAISSAEKKRPIIFSAVTDPHALGLIHPNTNVCGISDMINVKAEIEMIQQLIPQARKIGLLFTAGETNSIALVQKMKKELALHGLESIEFAVNSEVDIPTVVELACRKVDVILAPTDNTVALSIPLITSLTCAHKKPLIVSDNMLVKAGALAACGVDYHECGKAAAHQAQAIFIERKKLHELSIKQAQSKVVINQQTLKALGLQVPESLKKHVI